MGDLSAHSLLTPLLLIHLCLFWQLNLSDNRLCGVWTDEHGNKLGNYTAEGITAIADAVRVHGGLTSLDLSNNALCGVTFMGGTYTAEGITAIAHALRVNGGLTALDLSSNNLKDEGVSAVCEAIQSNKETKLASLNVKKNGIGSIGANAVAAMVAVSPSQAPLTRRASAIAVMPSAV